MKELGGMLGAWLMLVFEKRILRICVYQCHPVLFLVTRGEHLQIDVSSLKEDD